MAVFSISTANCRPEVMEDASSWRVCAVLAQAGGLAGTLHSASDVTLQPYWEGEFLQLLFRQ